MKYTIWKTQRKCEDSIKMDLREMESGGMDWIDLAQDRQKWRVV